MRMFSVAVAKSASSLALALLLMLAFGRSVAARHISVAADDDDNNAATWYAQAFAALDRIDDEEWAILDDYRGRPDAAPTDEVRRILSKAQPIFDAVRRGASRGYSDYGLDYSQGFELLLPHLSESRQVARLLQADAQRRLAEGDARGAAERIALGYRMADHLGDDSTLISSLVGQAIFRTAEIGLQVGLDVAAFGAMEGSMLLEAARSLDPVDPFRMADAVMMEQVIAIESMRAHIEAGDVAEFAGMLALNPKDAAKFAGAADGMGLEQWEAEFAAYSALMDRAAACFANPDEEAARAEMAAIEAEIAAGQHGILAEVLAPSLGKAFDTTLASRAMLYERLAQLEAIAAGTLPPEELANAAVRYRRGIELLKALGNDWRQPVREFDPCAEDASARLAALGVVLKAAGPAIDEFRAGAALRRCDFALGREEHEFFVPAYASGLRDAFALLCLDAYRLARAGDVEGAIERLASANRIAGHLSGDGLLVTSAVAHEGFNRVVATGLCLWPDADGADAERWLALAGSLRRLRPADPFGYRAALTKAHEQQLKHDLLMPAPDAGADPAPERIKDFIEGLDTNRLIYLMAVADHRLKTTESGEPTTELEAPLSAANAAGLTDWLILDQIDLARDEARRRLVEPYRSVRDLQASLDAAPIVVDFNDRVAKAREDLSAAVRVFLLAKAAMEVKAVAEGSQEQQEDR